ncbi:pirin family protein [Elioraea sp.]|uniref:pirin family protein n=1 Tax=Elioraea sp. TaxID=2185103 RepID=UPI003F715CB7
MSWLPASDPDCPATPDGAVETVIVPRSHDVGGFEVRRALPSAKRRMVGPFIFWDQMGPGELVAGQGIDVRPHPHIGLATVTYLFEGGVMHRDSLGVVQEIAPGAVNWMTAGRGIAHSERTPAALRASGSRLFGIQSWIALPRALEETEPGFAHTPAEALPTLEDGGVALTLVAGSAFGVTSPVRTASDTLYADVTLGPEARFALPRETEERALYVLTGAVEIAGTAYPSGQLLVFRAGDPIHVTATEPARVLVLGGAAMDGPRHIWWNFVSSSRERIEQAKADWKAGRFVPVPDEAEFIPLPE